MDFYADTLVAEGWTEDESQSVVMSGTAILAYLKDGETLSLTINEDSQDGGIMVIIAGEATQ